MVTGDEPMKTSVPVDTDNSVTIVVAEQYSAYPMGRDNKDGKYNGTRFRQRFLMPNLIDDNVARVNVDLNGLELTGSSFLEESFGGLVREGLSKEQIDKLNIISNRRDLCIEIADYIKTAMKEIQSE
jgi:hypothetical protein